MPVITLLTDFGLTDEYVGAMKGAILSINPAATLIDISHAVSPQDVNQAADLLASAYPYFPPATIHVSVVDPGVGSQRRILAMAMDGHIFVAPDNGLLAPLVKIHPPTAIVSVQNRRFFRNPVSQTFHGRDIFAPVAGHLSVGVALTELGPRLGAGQLVPAADVQTPVPTADGSLTGRIVAVDHFGNLITDIDHRQLKQITDRHTGRSLNVRIGRHRLQGLAESYTAVAAETPLAIIGSRGKLELAVNRGSAADYFGSGRGDQVTVTAGERTDHAVKGTRRRSSSNGQPG